MNLPEANKADSKEAGEEVFTSNDKKPNRKFLKIFTRTTKSAKSRDDDTLTKKTLSSNESANNNENNAGVMNTPKKTGKKFKLPHLRTPKKKYSDPATLGDEDYGIHLV